MVQARSLALAADFALNDRLPRHGSAPTTLEETRAEAEREVIRQALERAGGNVAAAARALGVERTRLHKRLRALGLDKTGAP